MLSIDTNLLLYGAHPGAPAHAAADAFLAEAGRRNDVALSELVLVELYVLLRNPTVMTPALTAPEAAALVQAWRRHPRWQVVSLPPDSRPLHDALWVAAARPTFARRRIFDARLALSLRAFGVTELATANVADFGGFGFRKVFDPCAAV